MATARGAARRAVAPRGRAQGRVRGARARIDFVELGLAARARARPRRRAVRAAARARPAHPAPARRRVPGHLAVAGAAARAADRRLGARRRPHAVPRRRSDAVDLPFPRRRLVAVPGSASSAVSATLRSSRSRSRATSAPRRRSSRGSTRRSRTYFRSVDQIAAGAAAFRASVATRTAARRPSSSQVHGSQSPRTRARRARASPRSSRPSSSATRNSRSPCSCRAAGTSPGLRERLRARGWPVHAVEIDALGEQPIAQDLLGLARALAHLDDRIAWLAVLRAPWCGLTWADLACALSRRARGAQSGISCATPRGCAR